MVVIYSLTKMSHLSRLLNSIMVEGLCSTFIKEIYGLPNALVLNSDWPFTLKASD